MRRPIHLWIVGFAALVWNSGGAFDYVMIQTANPAYLAAMPEPHRALLDAAPLWYDAGWAVGVWLSVFGSLLLLLRSRLAGPAFGLAWLGLLTASVYSFVLAKPAAWTFAEPVALGFTGAIFVVLLFLWWYARRMTRRGVLG